MSGQSRIVENENVQHDQRPISEGVSELRDEDLESVSGGFLRVCFMIHIEK